MRLHLTGKERTALAILTMNTGGQPDETMRGYIDGVADKIRDTSVYPISMVDKNKEKEKWISHKQPLIYFRNSSASMVPDNDPITITITAAERLALFYLVHHVKGSNQWSVKKYCLSIERKLGRFPEIFRDFNPFNKSIRGSMYFKVDVWASISDVVAQIGEGDENNTIQ